MPENPMDSTANIATIKRYAPPNQRNRSHGRRKSGGDKLERANSKASDGEKNHIAAVSNLPVLDHGDTRSSSVSNEYPVARLISLQGCCNSAAFELLNNRWQAAMNAYENPSTDLAERPILYSSDESDWGEFRLPHQMMQQPTVDVEPSTSQSERRRAMHNSSANSDVTYNYTNHEISNFLFGYCLSEHF